MYDKLFIEDEITNPTDATKIEWLLIMVKLNASHVVRLINGLKPKGSDDPTSVEQMSCEAYLRWLGAHVDKMYKYHLDSLENIPDSLNEINGIFTEIAEKVLAKKPVASRPILIEVFAMRIGRAFQELIDQEAYRNHLEATSYKPKPKVESDDIDAISEALYHAMAEGIGEMKKLGVEYINAINANDPGITNRAYDYLERSAIGLDLRFSDKLSKAAEIYPNLRDLVGVFQRYVIESIQSEVYSDVEEFLKKLERDMWSTMLAVFAGEELQLPDSVKLRHRVSFLSNELMHCADALGSLGDAYIEELKAGGSTDDACLNKLKTTAIAMDDKFADTLKDLATTYNGNNDLSGEFERYATMIVAGGKRVNVGKLINHLKRLILGCLTEFTNDVFMEHLKKTTQDISVKVESPKPSIETDGELSEVLTEQNVTTVGLRLSVLLSYISENFETLPVSEAVKLCSVYGPNIHPKLLAASEDNPELKPYVKVFDDVVNIITDESLDNEAMYVRVYEISEGFSNLPPLK